jgi:hypothetical protein
MLSLVRLFLEFLQENCAFGKTSIAKVDKNEILYIVLHCCVFFSINRLDLHIPEEQSLQN